MSKLTLYKKNFSSPAQITDEVYIDLGASAVILGEVQRSFKGGADMVIRTALGGGGTLLVENTDYTLGGIDTRLTAEAGFNVYSTVTIINVTFQTGALYFTDKVIASYVDSDWANTLQESSSGYYRNMLLNGDLKVAQEQITTSVSGEYFVDQWRLIHNNTVTALQDGTYHFTNSKYSGKLDFTGTVIGEYGGIDTPIPAYRSSVYFGKSAKIRFDIDQTAISAGTQSVEVIVQCPDAEDSGTGYETLVTSAAIALDGTSQSLSATLDLSGSTSSLYTVKNGALIFIKITQAGATGTSTVYIGDVQINEGDILLPFQPRNDFEELLSFYEKSYDMGEYPGVSTANGGIENTFMTGFTSLARQIQTTFNFSTPKFKVPTITIYPQGGTTVGNVSVTSGDVVGSIVYSGEQGGSVAGSDPVAAVNAKLRFHWVADARIA